MSEEISPQFDKTIETEIERLQEEVKHHKENPETQNLPEREIVRRSVDSLLPKMSEPPFVPNPESPLTEYAQASPEKTQLEIEELLEIAFQKGVFAADAEAQKRHPFIQDAFRDALAGRLHKILEERGMLE